MREVINISNPQASLEKELTLYNIRISKETLRSGGKGGQNVNKVETGVRLRVAVDDLVLLSRLKELYPNSFTDEGEFLIRSTEHRTQEGNLKAAYTRLRERLNRASEVPKERLATEASFSSKEKRISEKRQRGELKRARERVREWDE